MTYERVAVLMGGWGEEREISVRTGEAVARALQKQRAPRQVHRVLAGPGLDRALRGLDVQAVFVALHGRMGEDGSVQGLLEVLELPYTGSGVLASALAMDKPMAKKVLAHHNLPTPRGYVTAAAPAEEVLERHGDFGFPVVVKPARSGSSCGLSVVADAGALPAAVASAARFGGAVLVERLVRGRELTVAVLDDEVLGSCEIQPSAGVFDHASKYGGRSRYRLRPRVSPTRLRNVEALALAAHRALGCRGASRIDLLVSDTDNDVVLEVNTLPGMTRTSLLPKIAEARGLPFEALVERMLSCARLDYAAATGEPSAPVATAPRAALAG